MTPNAFQRRQRIVRALAQLRMDPYLLETGNNRRQALRLYQWNIRVSAAICEQLSVIEVVLRNSMDGQLRAWHENESEDPDWLLVETMSCPLHSLAASKRQAAYRMARRSVHRRPQDHHLVERDLTHDDVLASTTFGMWKDLLPNHASDADAQAPQNVGRRVLWDQALKDAFPDGPQDGGADAYRIVAGLHGLRNRVSHLEPLLRVNLVGRMQDAARLAGSIDPAVAQWLTGQNRVPALVKERPGQ